MISQNHDSLNNILVDNLEILKLLKEKIIKIEKRLTNLENAIYNTGDK